jgi:hypothetical protein
LINIQSDSNIPIIYSVSAKSAPSSPVSDVKSGIFKHFLQEEGSYKKRQNSQIVESIFKATNVVELQIWLQYLINTYQQDTNSSFLSSSSSHSLSFCPALAPATAVDSIDPPVAPPSSKRRNTVNVGSVDSSVTAGRQKAQKEKELFRKRNSYLL